RYCCRTIQPASIPPSRRCSCGPTARWKSWCSPHASRNSCNDPSTISSRRILMFECYNQSMQQVPQTAEFDERRDAPRVEIARRYSIRLDPCDGRAPIICALLDFSVTGVRLELPDNMPMPEQVKVLIGELSHNARI